MLASIKTYILQRKALFIFLILYILVRLPLLDAAFLLRGERDIVLTGWSLLKTGKDFYGNLFPVAFFGLDQPSPFFSFYFSALGWLFLPMKTIFFARLPFMLVSGVSMVLVYEIIQLIAKSKKIALVTAIVLGMSPGYYHLSMLALEINIAMPFLLAGMLLYLKDRKVWASVCLAVSFFSYNGFRPLIPFLIGYLELYQLMITGNLKVFVRNSIVAAVLFTTFFAATYAFVDGKIMTSRSSDLVFLSYDKIEPLVIFRRNTTTSSDELARTLNNKVSNTFYYMIEVLQEGIGLDYLFFKGDRAAIYTSTFGGQFFMISVLFYFMGWLQLGRKMKKEYFYVLGFIPVALIPSVINIDYVSVAIRSLLASVSYAFVIALGLLFVYELLGKVKVSYRILAYVVIVALFGVELTYFSYNYIYRRPVTMFESYFEHERQAADYLTSARKAGEKVIVYDDSPKNILTAYEMVNSEADIRDLQRTLSTGDKTLQIDGHSLRKCPRSGEKEVMFKKGTVIAASCLDPDQYDQLNTRMDIGRLYYKDFSLRTAYFIYELPEKGERRM